MKYMLMMNAKRARRRGLADHELGAGGHQGAHRFHDALRGELKVRQPRRREGWLSCRKQDRARRSVAPEVTDGRSRESKEFLAGHWIVDVESAGGLDIAARARARLTGRRADECNRSA